MHKWQEGENTQTDLDLVKVREHVQLGDVDALVVVERVRVVDHGDVQPAAAARAARAARDQA
jgi:hypothetical protein